jgi:hypothetical protein
MNKKNLIIISSIVVFLIIVFLLTRDKTCNNLLQDGYCVKTCSSGYYLTGKNCVKSCPLKIKDGACVSKCAVDDFISNGNECVTSCNLRDGKICVSSCPSGKVPENGICKLIPYALPIKSVQGSNGLSDTNLLNVYNKNTNDIYFSNVPDNLLTFEFNNGPYYVVGINTIINISNPVTINNTPYSTPEPTPFVLTLYDNEDNIIYKKDNLVTNTDITKNVITINERFNTPKNLNIIKYRLTPFSHIYEITFIGRKSE